MKDYVQKKRQDGGESPHETKKEAAARKRPPTQQTRKFELSEDGHIRPRASTQDVASDETVVQRPYSEDRPSLPVMRSSHRTPFPSPHGRIDPFDTFPIPVTASDRQLIQHCECCLRLQCKELEDIG